MSTAHKKTATEHKKSITMDWNTTTKDSCTIAGIKMMMRVNNNTTTVGKMLMGNGKRLTTMDKSAMRGDMNTTVGFNSHNNDTQESNNSGC